MILIGGDLHVDIEERPKQNLEQHESINCASLHPVYHDYHASTALYDMFIKRPLHSAAVLCNMTAKHELHSASDPYDMTAKRQHIMIPEIGFKLYKQVEVVDQTTLPLCWNSFVGTGIQDRPVPPAEKHMESMVLQ